MRKRWGSQWVCVYVCVWESNIPQKGTGNMSDVQKPLVTSICFTYSHTHGLAHKHTHAFYSACLSPQPLVHLLQSSLSLSTHIGDVAPATPLWPVFSWLLRWMQCSDEATFPRSAFFSISVSETKQVMRTGAQGTQSPPKARGSIAGWKYRNPP